MKILVLTNHSYMLWRFRKELISTLLEENEVVISTPFVGHEEDFERMGCRCLETPVDRRGVNPATDLKLLRAYRQLLRAERPDLVLTYSIKPNIYGGLACRMMRVPYCANVQGLGTAFQRPGLARLVTVLYRTALSGARRVFLKTATMRRCFSKAYYPAEEGVCAPWGGRQSGGVPPASLQGKRAGPLPLCGPYHEGKGCGRAVLGCPAPKGGLRRGDRVRYGGVF
ncbi:MAG: glycosyltransferase [Intestinimonas sp.]